jgi:hypothetical protein
MFLANDVGGQHPHQDEDGEADDHRADDQASEEAIRYAEDVGDDPHQEASFSRSSAEMSALE